MASHPSRMQPSGRSAFSSALLGSLLFAAGGSLAAAQVTERINVTPSGGQSGLDAYMANQGRQVSDDGRYVAFWTDAGDLVPGDTNAQWDVFLRDRLTQTTERVSVGWNGAQASGGSGLTGFSMSADGRFIAFYSSASNLIPGGTNGAGHIFLRDRVLGTTELISKSSLGVQGNGFCSNPALSDDGRFVVFESYANNLVPGDTNGYFDVFVRDRRKRTTERVSVATDGSQANEDSYYTAISNDGRIVAFASDASNLVAADTNARTDIFVRDRWAAATERVSISGSGAQANFGSFAPSLSADGNLVAFYSAASNLVAGDTNGAGDLFVRDRQLGTMERANVPTGGVQSFGGSETTGKISANGRFVVFVSSAQDLVVPGVIGQHIYVRDRYAGTTALASVATNGALANNYSNMPSISADGRYVAFGSAATNLVPNDTGTYHEIFLHDRFATGFISLCEPGSNGVLPCPCGNPPSAARSGCNNSAGTGGAALSASGNAYLAIDSLIFTTNGEQPNAASLVLQGDTLLEDGVRFGQGVRCVGGTLRRLYSKLAIGGSISAPNLGAGDATVSARSAALGDTILPGESRYYVVSYRDPLVLGSCPTSSTFNSTQTAQITWWP
jgi:Tol biopolymer transport system component